MDQNDFIANVKAISYAFRHGQTEKVLAALVPLFFAAAAYLRHEWKEFPLSGYLAYALYTLCAASALWLIYRVSKLATPPPQPPSGPVPSAIKGLLPFTVADGKLFAQLGRQLELQQLLALTQDDQIAISAVRGESGAGKTSLLQAGLAYTLGQEQCVYWEAVPEKAPDALLHAIRSQLPSIESLESLPEACPKRCVLLLDQFEQLRAAEPSQTPVFALLHRIAKAPAPRKLSAIVSFRREYAADWLDLEKDSGFRAEQVPVNLLARRTAGDALATLASEAGFTLDQALVENFITGIASPQGVSPVDIAIGVLSPANFVQQRGTTHVGMKEYGLAGGAEGLLLSFVHQKLEEIPEALRAPLLKGLVLALVNASNNQRIATGETVRVIASKGEITESELAPWLGRLAHPRVRLLERVSVDRYRLPHERLVPVLRRLAGAALASLDQLRMLFEGEYVRWRENHNRRHLLSGKDLRNVLRHREQFVQGETAEGKTEYLAVCLRRRAIMRLAVSVAVVAGALTGYVGYRAWDSSVQQQKLVSWHLPPEVFKMQDAVDQIDFSSHPVNDLTWLRSPRIKKLSLSFDGSDLVGLERLKGLTSLSLNLKNSNVTSLAELEHLQALTSLTLVLGDKVRSLAGLERLKGLTSLTLDLGDNWRVTSLSELEKLTELTELTLIFGYSEITSLAELEKLKGLTSLTLVLGGKVRSLAGLERLKGLTSLTLDLGFNWRVTSLAFLGRLKGLTSLKLVLGYSDVISPAILEQLKGPASLTLVLSRYGSELTSVTELKQLKGLTSLTLDLRRSSVKGLAELEQLKELTLLLSGGVGTASEMRQRTEAARRGEFFAPVPNASDFISLAELEKLTGLTSLSLDLSYYSKFISLAELEKLKGLMSLSLKPGRYGVTSLSGLERLTGLTSLTLGLRDSQITSPSELEKLTRLTSLTLDLRDSRITSLAGLEQLKGLTSIEITLPASLVSNFSRLKIRHDITQLHVLVDASTPLNIPAGCKFVGLTDH